MEHELRPLLIELCHLAAKRNAINTRRHRARFRKNYYANAVRVVEAHNESNYELRSLGIYGKRDNTEKNRWTERRDSILGDMQYIRDKYVNHKKPLKWQKMGLHQLRSLVLKNEGLYATAKYQTMEFTIKYRAKFKYILSKLNGSTSYNNGELCRILLEENSLDVSDINKYAEQYELSKAVEGMLRK